MKSGRILFITRKYPPSVGGMERYAKQCYESLREHDVLIDLLTGNPLKLTGKMFSSLLRREMSYSQIHLGDGALVFLAMLAKAITRGRVKTSITFHGLDVLYSRFGYPRYLKWCSPYVDRAVCVSEATKAIALARTTGITLWRVIPNGIRDEPLYTSPPRNAKSLQVLLVGRQVRRKGVAWFLCEVAPSLPEGVFVTIIGNGPEHNAIYQAWQRLPTNIRERISLHTDISDEALTYQYARADCFLMPNIAVAKDMEGFGIVALEAALSYTIPLVADMEGIRDAVYENKNGHRCTPENAESYLYWITYYRDHPQKRREMQTRSHDFVLKTFHWDDIQKRYQKEVFS